MRWKSNHRRFSPFLQVWTSTIKWNAPQKINLRLHLFKWTFACSETFWSAFQTVCKSDFLKNFVHGKFTAGCLLWHLALQIDWGGGCEKKISLTADLYHRLLSDPIWSIFVIREDSEKRGVLFAEWQITCCSFIGRFDSTGGFLTWFGPLGQKQILK